MRRQSLGVAVLSALVPHCAVQASDEHTLPGPVAFPSTPTSASDLPDFISKLNSVRRAFWEFKTRERPPADVGGELFLESESEQRPLSPGESLLSCADFNHKASEARVAWAEVAERASRIEAEAVALKNEQDPQKTNASFYRIEAMVREANVVVERIAKNYPSSLFSRPDRIVRYTWRVVPQDLFQVWEPRWHLESASFQTTLLALPGFTWSGQGDVTDVEQVNRAPFASGQDIVFERVATPASACAAPESVWLTGSVIVTYKRPYQGTTGCLGGSTCSAATFDPVIQRDSLTVNLYGRPNPEIGKNRVPVPNSNCPKGNHSFHNRPPDICPN